MMLFTRKLDIYDHLLCQYGAAQPNLTHKNDWGIKSSAKVNHGVYQSIKKTTYI